VRQANKEYIAYERFGGRFQSGVFFVFRQKDNAPLAPLRRKILFPTLSAIHSGFSGAFGILFH
jgi:hypothetical protein